jgi:hypothetical protein
MPIATKQWSDINRFNQGGYSAPTLFPIAINYVNVSAFNEDYAKAQKREESRNEWLEELRDEARAEAYEESREVDEDE